MAERRRGKDGSHPPWSPYRPSQCCMRDLGTGHPGPDMSLCGECRTQQGSPWISWKLHIEPTEKTQTKTFAIDTTVSCGRAHPQALRLRRTASRLRGLT